VNAIDLAASRAAVVANDQALGHNTAEVEHKDLQGPSAQAVESVHY